MPAHLPRVKARLALHAHRKVHGLLEGEYAAVHSGRSMDFNDLRAYVRGDDVKDLDWKASARARTLLVRRYVALRQHTIQLVVSTSRTMAAANTLETPKRDLAVFVAGVIGSLAVRHGDHVALVYGDQVRQHALPPATGEVRLERCLGAIHDATTRESGDSDLTEVLRYVARTVKRRTIMVIVCDDYAIDDELAAALRRMVAQHEVLLVTVGDLDPTAIAASAAVVDVGTGRGVPSWLREDAQLAAEFAEVVSAELADFRRRLDALGVVHAHVHDDQSAISAVFHLLERQRRARR